MSRVLRKLAGFGRYLLLGGLLFILLISGFLWYTTTDSFQRMVRRRLINSIERATGGRAELGSFHAVPLHFQVEVRNLTIHGREAPDELPLVHVDSLSAVVNLSSVFGARIGFRSLTLSHPVVHIIFYPDGSTNQPSPAQQGSSDLARLFSISIDRLEVRRGELLLQDRQLPLEFVSNDVSANLDYSFLHQRYSGSTAIGRAETHFDGYRPVNWSGQAAFSVDSAGIQLQSVTATAGDSKLVARGSVTNFRDPVFKGSYDLVISLPQAAATLRQTQVTSGSMEIQGSGSWSSETFAANGKFDVRDVGWKASDFNTKNASVNGDFVVDPKKIQLLHVGGHILRGSFTSDAEINDWRTTQRSSARSSVQRGTVKLKMTAVSLAELLAGLGSPYRPIKDLRLAGDLSGNAEIGWRESWRNAEVSSTFEVARPARESNGQLPLAARGTLRYQLKPNILELSDFTASTPATQVRASGSLNTSAAMRFSFASTNIGEWRPIISALVPESLPIAIRGRAAFSGTVSGAIPDVNLSGNLQLQEFDTALPKRAAGPPIHWDSLNADLQMSPHSLDVRDATAHSGDMSVALRGQIGLLDWKPVADSGFQAHLTARNVEAAAVATEIAPDLALRGKVDLQLDSSGSFESPRGSGNVHWTNGSVNGYAFDSATADIALHGRQVAIQKMDVQHGEARISGHGTYDVAAKSFQLAVSGTNFTLAEVQPLQRSRIAITGAVDFSADLSGTQTAPDVNAQIHVRDLTFNGERAGDYLLSAVTHGQNLNLTGHSEFKTAQLAINGNVSMRDRWPSRVDFHFSRLDIDAFIQSYLHGHITGHSSVAGDLSVQGPLLDPEQLQLTGVLTELGADVEKFQLHNQGPVQFSVEQQTAKISNLHIVGENTDLSASGSVQLTGERTLDVQGSGQIGLQLVQSYDPDLSGSGTVRLEGKLTGTLSVPKVRGKLEIDNGSLADLNLPSALSAINGVLVFNQNQVTIESLKAQTGGGNVSFGGRAELVGDQVNFDLSAKGDSVRLRYPPGVSSTATADLRWSGSNRGSLLAGDVTITKIGVTPGFDFGSYLEKAVQEASLPQTDPVLNKIRLDLHVVTTPELQMQTSVLRVRGDADMRVRGNAAKPVLLGRAEIFEGEAYFNGTKYRLERGGITFGTPAANNPSATVPYVDFEATTRVQDYDITLSINGPADRPKLTYRSEPPLPTNDIIGLLAFGSTSEQSAMLQQNSQSAFSQQASNAMLAAALNATLNNRAQRLFGNSRIKIDPQGLETETSPTQSGPAVTIEQQVKDNLTVTYTTNVAQASQQIIRAEYNISRNISVVAIRDWTGVISFDVKIRRRKR